MKVLRNTIVVLLVILMTLSCSVVFSGCSVRASTDPTPSEPAVTEIPAATSPATVAPDPTIQPSQAPAPENTPETTAPETTPDTNEDNPNHSGGPYPNPNEYVPDPNQRLPIIITKYPYDELYLVDGQERTSFIARADNYDWITWEFKIGDDGVPFSTETAMNQYGISLSGTGDEQIYIYNISWTLDGWRIRAVFHQNGGEDTYTTWAKLALMQDAVPPPEITADPGMEPTWPAPEDYFNPRTMFVLGMGVNIRSGPGEQYGVVGSRNAGETVEVEATIGNWYKIAGWDHYISMDWVTSNRQDVISHFAEQYGTIMIVDISYQHAYCYVGGSLLGDTDCVTGDYYSSPTPTGLYTMWYFRDHFYMQDNPNWWSNYASFFNGGIAIHDADAWRSEYGGSIYIGNGSHGCVNTPAWFSELVYNNSSIGTYVLVIP